MKIIRHSKVTVEKLVIVAKPGDPDLLNLLTSDDEDWILDWNIGDKFVLKREEGYEVLEVWPERCLFYGI